MYICKVHGLSSTELHAIKYKINEVPALTFTFNLHWTLTRSILNTKLRLIFSHSKMKLWNYLSKQAEIQIKLSLFFKPSVQNMRSLCSYFQSNDDFIFTGNNQALSGTKVLSKPKIFHLINFCQKIGFVFMLTVITFKTMKYKCKYIYYQRFISLFWA